MKYLALKYFTEIRRHLQIFHKLLLFFLLKHQHYSINDIKNQKKQSDRDYDVDVEEDKFPIVP